eukprot:TRINITY_DN26165_c0_g1_i1.p1 TRINITY_DN26165_c0_g1~~TRINITY_DN26165_c0_g1_i1.p1  ORF type:complete len:466 (+),score=107.45 TRINITY_DN26165_c0_g1_i1:34-1398(+)
MLHDVFHPGKSAAEVPVTADKLSAASVTGDIVALLKRMRTSSPSVEPCLSSRADLPLGAVTPRGSDASKPSFSSSPGSSNRKSSTGVVLDSNPSRTGEVVKVSRKKTSSQQLRKRPRQDAEAIAEEALKGDISFETVHAALEAADIPMTGSRKNVLPEGVEAIQGMVLGLYAYAANLGTSVASERNPWLARPGFAFTSIQVNKNYAARPHVDKNNLGSSLIVGIGDYEGGELWVHDEENGDAVCELKEDISSMYHYRSGVQYRGRDLSIRRQWHEFDGNRLHFTRPFSGTRFSLIYFTCGRFRQAPEEVRCALTSAGFPFSWSDHKLQETLQQKQEEKQRCRELYQAETKEKLRREKEELGHCFARTWNRGWGGDCPHYRQKDGGDFCQAHAKGTWKTHGRTDGPVPEKKQLEMLKWQRILLAKSELPPSPLPMGAVILVKLPGSAQHEAASAS